MAATVVTPSPRPHVRITDLRRRVAVCLGDSDDQETLLDLARRLTGSEDAKVCWASSSVAGASIPRHREADMLIMTDRYCAQLCPEGRPLPLRMVRTLEKPILFLHSDRVEALTKRNEGSAIAAVSLSERSRQVVDSAASLASALGASLRVLHVVDAQHNFSRPDSLMGLFCACEILGRSASRAGGVPEVKVCDGSLCDAFTRSELREASFLALGVDQIEGQEDSAATDDMLEQIVRNAPCAVLLIPTRSGHLG